MDDATSTTLSVLDDGETTKAVMTALKQWIEKYGIPQEIYVDKKSVYIAPVELSVFEQACKRLGIEVIPAHSAQAKGRVERNHKVYQDLFMKELWLSGIEDIAGANRILQDYFIDELNTKFAKEPLSSRDAHAPLLDTDLEEVLRWQYKRQLQNDWTISFRGKAYQIIEEIKGLQPKQSIQVRQYLDGSLKLFHGEESLPYSYIGQRVKRQKTCLKKGHSSTVAQAAALKGKAKSPWRFSYKRPMIEKGASLPAPLTAKAVIHPATVV